MNNEQIDELVENAVGKLDIVANFIHDLDNAFNNAILPPPTSMDSVEDIFAFADSVAENRKNKQARPHHSLYMLLVSVHKDLSILRQAAFDRPYFGQ